MKVSIKTLTGKKLEIEIEPSQTIAQLKAKITETEGSPVELQKLIHSGLVLADAKTLTELNIKESDFLVLMVTKKVTPAPKAATPSAAASAPASASVGAPSNTTAASSATPNTATASAAGPAAPIPRSADETAAVNNLVDMGFPRERVELAMRASFGNAERAVQYLTEDNIPTFNEDAIPAPSTSGSDSTAPPMGAGGMPPALADVFNTPQFRQMIQVVQQNPALLQPILQQLGQSNPELLTLLNANQGELMRQLQGGGAGGQEGEDEGDEGQAAAGGPASQIQITPQEGEAIERLEELGFSRAAAAQAFLACDKNEELAANYLLNNIDDQD